MPRKASVKSCRVNSQSSLKQSFNHTAFAKDIYHPPLPSIRHRPAQVDTGCPIHEARSNDAAGGYGLLLAGQLCCGGWMFVNYRICMGAWGPFLYELDTGEGAL